MLIYSTCLYTWNDEIITEFIYDIFNLEFGSTGKFCSFIQSVQFVSLTAVYTAADNVVIKSFF